MRKKKTEGLTPRIKNFCASYLDCGNAQEAAISAGFVKNAKRAGEKLLSDPRVVEEIERLSQLRKKLLSQLAYTGYLRLAFGGISDAVKLLFADGTDAKLTEEMDLFSVAEIRRPKDGSMEIKFADRLKALEKLEQALPENAAGAVPFYEALRLASESVADKSERVNSTLEV